MFRWPPPIAISRNGAWDGYQIGNLDAYPMGTMVRWNQRVGSDLFLYSFDVLREPGWLLGLDPQGRLWVGDSYYEFLPSEERWFIAAKSLALSAAVPLVQKLSLDDQSIWNTTGLSYEPITRLLTSAGLPASLDAAGTVGTLILGREVFIR